MAYHAAGLDSLVAQESPVLMAAASVEAHQLQKDAGLAVPLSACYTLAAQDYQTNWENPTGHW